MNYKVLALPVAVVLLAGCGSKQDDAVSDAASSCVSFYSPLPDDTIRFDFPFHLARDHIYTVETGAVRRRVILEYFNKDPNQVWTRLTEAMSAAGYIPKGEARGQYERSYAKQGEKDLFIALFPGPVEDAANPESVGSIRISWQLVPASAANDVAASAPTDASDTAAPTIGSNEAPAPATRGNTTPPASDGQPADTGN